VDEALTFTKFFDNSYDQVAFGYPKATKRSLARREGPEPRL
jgi:hypothetical protein